MKIRSTYISNIFLIDLPHLVTLSCTKHLNTAEVSVGTPGRGSDSELELEPELDGAAVFLVFSAALVV